MLTVTQTNSLPAGIDLPVNIKIDYAFIPTYEITGYDFNTGAAYQKEPTLHMFRISIIYNFAYFSTYAAGELITLLSLNRLNTRQKGTLYEAV